MPGHESVAREWLLKAENDLKAAAQVLKLGEDCPTDAVCFHAQQCVEKYLKTLLILAGSEFPRTHDVEELISLLRPDLRPQVTPPEQAALTRYATVIRYPGDYSAIPLSEARKAVAIARRVRKAARAALPPDLLRRKSK